MKKRLLSLALALILSLSLSVPALAAGQPGDTTVTDAKGNVYTLSKPILYTIPVSDLDIIQGDDFYELTRIKEEVSVIYAIPVDTLVTAPDGGWLNGMLGVYLTEENGTFKPSYEVGPGYPDKTILYEEGDEGILLGHICSFGGTIDESSGYLTDDAVNNGWIAFFVPWNEKAGNPFASSATPTNPSKPAFTDVADNAFYAEPVAWAVEKNITSGTTATTFSPDETCTKAQILSFLWRAKGSPEPISKTNPFSDIKTSDYFYKAALWAKEKGLVSGTAFGGNTPCTRSATVTYLWKLAGSPSASSSAFTDVPQTEKYAQAVAWAVQQGITSGTSATTFSPDATCTRGQIVTFLYRAYK